MDTPPIPPALVAALNDPAIPLEAFVVAASARLAPIVGQLAQAQHPSTPAMSQALIRLHECQFWISRAADIQNHAMRKANGIQIASEVPPAPNGRIHTE